ncbi:MAG: 50S ribosomal protein L5 [Patescibacteria group bacterium]
MDDDQEAMEKLKEKFEKELKPRLMKELGKANVYEVPRVEKVVVSTGVGAVKEDKEMISRIAGEIARITGQQPKINQSRRSVSAFKLRTGQVVGLTVTLRGDRMYDFIAKLINVALPRVRDFRGTLLKSFDGRGNYSLGIREYSIFPEVRYENIPMMFGLEVNIKTTAKNSEEARALLTALGFPFEKH